MVGDIKLSNWELILELRKQERRDFFYFALEKMLGGAAI